MKRAALILLLTLSNIAWAYSWADPWETGLQRKIEARDFPDWMLKQIEKDLAPFRERGISSEMLGKIIASNKPWNTSLLARFRIRDGEVYMVCGNDMENLDRFRCVTRALTYLSECVRLPDCDFIVSMHDACPYVGDRQTFEGPIFVFAKDKYKDDKVILIPDFEALRGNDWLIDEVKRANGAFPWSKKRASAIWRGGSTGGVFNLSNYRAYPRFRLIDLSFQFPKLLDARLTVTGQMDEVTRQEITQKGYVGDFISVYDHIRYKYQILVDGNTCTYSRAYWQLFSNCLIFKQESDNIQWYYGDLKPDVHYIPVAHDFSDLIPKMRLAMKEEAKVRKIIANANEFAESHLHREEIFLYLYLLLYEYSKLGVSD